MTMPWENPNRPNTWDKRGFGLANNLNYQVAQPNKLDDLRKRTVDKNAVSCVIPIFGSLDFNSSCWISLKKNFEMNNIKFLISAEEKQQELEENGMYYKLSSEELAEVLYPHAMTENLIQEAVSLNADIRDNKIKLTEPSSGTKDLIVVLSYLNYIADKMENEYNKFFYDAENEDGIEDIQLVY